MPVPPPRSSSFGEAGLWVDAGVGQKLFSVLDPETWRREVYRKGASSVYFQKEAELKDEDRTFKTEAKPCIPKAVTRKLSVVQWQIPSQPQSVTNQTPSFLLL